MRKTFFCVTLTILTALANLYGDDIAQQPGTSNSPLLMDEDEQGMLFTEGQITRYFFENIPPKWLPDEGLGDTLRDEISKIRTTIGVESAYFITTENIQWPGNTDFTDEEVLRIIYNTLLSISTLKGIEYYSTTRDRLRTLFAESYRIAEPDDPRPVADTTANGIPEESILFAIQDDTTFGLQTNRLVYRRSNADLSLSISNLNPLKYSLLRVVREEGMQIHLFLSPVNGGLVFYGCAVARTARFLGFERSSKESFYYRIEALHSWLKDELARRAPR